jgi:hypothetical protein
MAGNRVRACVRDRGARAGSHEQRIRNAIRRASYLPADLRVYAKGSYANNTNVRRDADVDVAVEWNSTIKVGTWGKTAGMSPQELGYTPVDEPMTHQEFRRRVERALVDAFGSGSVDVSPDKCIGVARSSTTLDADAVPCFALHRYDAPQLFHFGHRIYSKSGGQVDNFPDQNLKNGNDKNAATRKRYKEIVRCLKRLEGELYDDAEIPRDYPGYLIECLVYNVPIGDLGHARRFDDMRAVLTFLLNGLRDERTYRTWTEPSRYCTGAGDQTLPAARPRPWRSTS